LSQGGEERGFLDVEGEVVEAGRLAVKFLMSGVRARRVLGRGGCVSVVLLRGVVRGGVGEGSE
jgi:hypothetical protein